MTYQSRIEKLKELQEDILEYLENPEESDTKYQKLINIKFGTHDFTQFIRLISVIASNHNHCPGFFTHIDQLLYHYKDRIKQSFSNSEIYELFKKSKRTLLYLIDQIISLDEATKKLIQSDEYFKIYFNSKSDKDVKAKLFEGENGSYICSLIRKDSVEDFITYLNRTNSSVNGLINYSIFETNRFLLKQKKISLIEYAAFFGSIEIFQYLKMNYAKMKRNLWDFAIHSNNPSIIHLLEENQIQLIQYNAEKYFIKMIKCHHNNFAIYIRDQHLNENDLNQKILNQFKGNVYYYAFRYFNYAFIPEKIDETRFIFYYLCMSHHLEIIKDYLEKKKVNNLELKNLILGKILIFKYFNII